MVALKNRRPRGGEFLTREVVGPVAERLDGEQAQFRVNLVRSQIIGPITARSIVGIEPLASAPPDPIAAALAPTIQRYLTGPLAEGDR